MIQSLLISFASRWLVSSLGLWIAAALLGESRLHLGHSLATVLGAGFLLAVVNMLVKPFLVFLSFPAIIITLGLFMLVLNGFMILLVSWLYDPLYVSSIWTAIVAGIIIGLVNYLVSHVVKDFDKK